MYVMDADGNNQYRLGEGAEPWGWGPLGRPMDAGWPSSVPGVPMTFAGFSTTLGTRRSL